MWLFFVGASVGYIFDVTVCAGVKKRRIPSLLKTTRRVDDLKLIFGPTSFVLRSLLLPVTNLFFFISFRPRSPVFIVQLPFFLPFVLKVAGGLSTRSVQNSLRQTTDFH